jgi:hypothetical protein
VEVPPWLCEQIAVRMVKANFEHLRHAWARRWSDPIGPHAVIYLYADAGGLRLAYRTFVAADEERLPHLLYNLIPHVRDQLAAGLDIRDAQCTAVEQMRPDAAYLGVAVSSLDTPVAAWDAVWPDARSELHVPGRSYVWLVDNTVMVVDRFAEDQFGRVMIHSSRYGLRATAAGYPVTVAPYLAIPDRQVIADPDVLVYLRELNATVWTAGAHPLSGGRHHAQ